MESSLFRPEVIDAESNQWLGAVRLAQPISLWLIVTVSGLLAVSLIAYLAFGNITRKAHVAGITVPVAGNLTIAVPSTAILKASLAKEGQKVSKGQILFELSTERMSDKGELTTLVGAQLAIRQQTLESERRTRNDQYRDKKKALADRKHNTEAELAQLEQEVKLAEYREKLGINSLEKYAILAKGGFVSSAQSQQKEEDLIDIRSHLVSLKRSRVQLETNLMSIQADAREIESSFASDLAQLDLSSAAVRQEVAENSGRKSLFIAAPQAGINE